jgi:dienelactone hydrolase
MERAMAIEDYEAFVFDHGGISHRVYRRGSGPAVLLMHELPGMTPACITLGDAIAESGFTTYMPLLFGEPGDDHAFLYGAQICLSREIYAFAEKGGSPITTWLRALGQKMHADCPAPGIGVIGLCLTGNFAISLMASPDVLAPVASEPALPFGIGDAAHAALAVTDADLAQAVTRSKSGVPFVCLQFSNDALSPKARFENLRNAFGSAFRGTEIDSSPGNAFGISTKAHSVLTGDFVDSPDHPTRLALDSVLAFLQKQLKGKL